MVFTPGLLDHGTLSQAACNLSHVEMEVIDQDLQ